MHNYRTISSLTNPFEITALDSNTSYTAWVKVDSVDYGASEWSDSINFDTDLTEVDNMDMIDQLKYIYVRNFPPVDLYLIFEKSSLKNQVLQTRFLVYFELDFYCLCSLQKSILKLVFAGLKSSL